MVKQVNNIKSESGFIALISALIISAVAFYIALSVALLGIGEADSSLSFYKGKVTSALAESCFDITLLKLRDNPEYSDNTLSLENGSCTIGIKRTDKIYDIEIKSTISEIPVYTKIIKARIKRGTNSINLIDWQEAQ